jgi:hypothetical protein
MTRALDPVEIFGGEYPHASFHDATLTRLEVDFVAARAVLDLRVWVGDPDASDKAWLDVMPASGGISRMMGRRNPRVQLASVAVAVCKEGS